MRGKVKIRVGLLILLGMGAIALVAAPFNYDLQPPSFEAFLETRSGQMIQVADAIKMVQTWNDRVARDGSFNVSQIADGHNHDVGSLAFQYDENRKVLIVRGILFPDTVTLKNPEDTFQRLIRYTERHPEKLGHARLEYLRDEFGSFNLRIDFKTVPETEEFMETLQKLSKTAYLWDVNGYYMDALFGR